MSVYNIFRPPNMDAAKHMAVGKCNGRQMEERWDVETGVFADAILRQCGRAGHPSDVLDFGCGPGRLARVLLAKDPNKEKIRCYNATDISMPMRKMALRNCGHDDRFNITDGALLDRPGIGPYMDVIIVSFVLQHMPAIRLNPAIKWLWSHSTMQTRLIFINSEARLAISTQGFVDDRSLGVDVDNELSRGFSFVEDLLTSEEASIPVVHSLLEGPLKHRALVLGARQDWLYSTGMDNTEFLT